MCLRRKWTNHSRMESEKAPAQMEQEFKDRAQWYCKDFGALLMTLRAHLEIFHLDDKTDERKKFINNCLGTMEALYACVDESKLQGNPDAELLLSMKELVRRIRTIVDRLLAGEENIYEEGMTALDILNDGGMELRSRLVVLRDEIRRNDGWKKFTLHTTDLFGNFAPYTLGD